MKRPFDNPFQRINIEKSYLKQAKHLLIKIKC